MNRYVDTLLRSYQSQVVAMPTQIAASVSKAQAKVVAGARQVQAQAMKKAADFSAKLALVDSTVVRDNTVKALEATKKAIEFTFLGAGAHAETSSEDNPFGWVEALPIAEERGGE